MATKPDDAATPTTDMSALASVLIVDDEPAVRELMARWVASLGMRPHTVGSADEALETLRRAHYDLAVIDVMMPGRDGLWLATQMRRDHPHTAVIISTGYAEALSSAAAPEPTVADFLIKPFQRDRFALAVDRGRLWRRNVLEDVEWHARLSHELHQRCDDLCLLVRRRADQGSSEKSVFIELVAECLADTLAHSERVARYAQSVARQMNAQPQFGDALEAAALFHDIGKIAMPAALLTKPSPLTSGEMAIMRRHAEIGAEMLDRTRTLRQAAPIVLASHEWFGGAGYPRRIAGSAIPLASRIIAVVDAYDAMTQDRAYRVRFDSTDAVAELLRCSPAQFDPDVVAAFLAVLGRH
jgi:putative nucleotidyltransferase with HDIG domain